ncbi:hypothetical protein BKA80DRAFT_253062 [Phyllosticta citrichinensis]
MAEVPASLPFRALCISASSWALQIDNPSGLATSDKTRCRMLYACKALPDLGQVVYPFSKQLSGRHISVSLGLRLQVRQGKRYAPDYPLWRLCLTRYAPEPGLWESCPGNMSRYMNGPHSILLPSGRVELIQCRGVSKGHLR